MLGVAIRLVVSLSIGGLFIWLIISKFEFGAVFSTDYSYQLDNWILAVNSSDGAVVWSLALWTVLPVLLILVLIHFIKVVRWRLLLTPLEQFDFWKVNQIGAVGFMSVLLFPLRLGEFVRPYLVAGSSKKTTMSEVMSTIVVERVIDGLTTAFFLVVGLQFLPRGDGSAYAMLQTGTYVALAVFGGIVILLFLTWYRKEWVFRLFDLTLGLVSQKLSGFAKHVLAAFFEGLEKIPNKKTLFGFLGLTMLYWGVNGLGIYILAHGFGIDLSLFGGYILMCALVIGIMIPGPPGQAGNFEIAILVPLALFSPTTAIANSAFTLGLHCLLLLQPVLFGLYFVLTGKVKIRRLVDSTRSNAAPTVAAESTANPPG